MDEPQWEPVVEQCRTHSATFVLRDPPCKQANGLYEVGGVRCKAWIKWDGCAEYEHTFNVPFGEPGHDEEDEQGMHICDIDALVAELLALKAAALRYFDGTEFGIGGVPNSAYLDTPEQQRAAIDAAVARSM